MRECVTSRNLVGNWALWAGSLWVTLVGWVHFGPPTVCGPQHFFPFLCPKVSSFGMVVTLD